MSVVTATKNQKGVGCKLDMGRRGEVVEKGVVARQVSSLLILLLNRYMNFHTARNDNYPHRPFSFPPCPP